MKERSVEEWEATGAQLAADMAELLKLEAQALSLLEDARMKFAESLHSTSEDGGAMATACASQVNKAEGAYLDARKAVATARRFEMFTAIATKLARAKP